MKNWKTTVIGIIAGLVTILQTTVGQEKINWYQTIIGFAIMALGVLAKDFDNVTPELPAKQPKLDAAEHPKG